MSILIMAIAGDPILKAGIDEALSQILLPVLNIGLVKAYTSLFIICLVLLLINRSDLSGSFYRVLSSTISIFVSLAAYASGRLFPEYSDPFYFEFAPAVLAALGINGLSTFIFAENTGAKLKELREENKNLKSENESYLNAIASLKEEKKTLE